MVYRHVLSHVQAALNTLRHRHYMSAGLLAAFLLTLASTVYAIARPAFLLESVDNMPAAGKTYQFWYTTFCAFPGIPPTCTCIPGGETNDCIATLDTNSDGLLDTAPDEDGDGDPDLVDPDFTTDWGDTSAVESVAYNLQQSIEVYVNTLGLRQPFWSVDNNRDIYIYDSDSLGIAASDGSAFELDTAYMLGVAPNPRTTVVHEIWHMIQYAYHTSSPTDGEWFMEGQARFIQDKVFADLDAQVGSRFTNSTALYLADPDYLVEWDFDDDGTPEATYFAGLLGASYDAALFWNYLTEQAGTDYAGTPSEGVDFLEEVLIQADDPFFAGQFATELALVNAVQRSFDDMWWDFTIANYAKDFDLDLLRSSQLDGRDPTFVLDYRDEAGTPYGNVARATFNATQLLAVQQGALEPQTIDLVLQGALFLPEFEGHVPPYGAQYFEGLLPSPAACPVAFWEAEGDPNAVLLHSSMLLQSDTDGDWQEEVIDLQRHKGDAIEVSYLNVAGASRIVGIVATVDEVEGYAWKMGCTTPIVDIVLPTETDMAAVGAPEAPGNFELWVEVTSSINGDPLSGLDATRDFLVTVGGEEAAILSADYVQDQYWMVVQAPIIAGASVGDTYDLRVELVQSGAADEEPNAVLYEAMPTDTVLVIDRSASMAQEGKLVSAQAAGRIKADATNQADHLGVASFSNDAREDFALTLVPDQDDAAGVRANAKAAIDALTDANQTSIGDGLAEARDMLSGDGNPDNKWVIVLLSDGAENQSLFWSDVQNSIISTVDEVHAITLGSAADPNLMREIAELTCGYRNVEECFWALSDDAAPVQAAAPGDLTNPLADIYLRIAETAADRQRIWQDEGTGNQTIQFEVARDDIQDALFSFNWKDPAQSLNVTITPPAGQGVTLVQRTDAQNHVVFYAESLPAGTYGINLAGGGAEWIGSVSAIVPESENLRAAFDNTKAESVLGEPARLRLSLVDKNGPVTDATVTATVYRADGDPAEETIVLNDAGAGADNRPGDGIYSYDYDKINGIEEHTYTFDIVATGTDFTRYKRVTYRPADTSIPDNNNDGLYDNWQQKYGVQGTNDDSDRDGLGNRAEQLAGTDPTHEDSDRGGESDGSEVNAGRNPLDPSDDAIPRVMDFRVENADQSAILYFNPRQEYGSVRVFQRTQGGPWTSLGDFPAATGMHTVTNLINDQEYLYFIQALAPNNVRGHFTGVRIAEPAADTQWPESELEINQGAAATNSTSATLSLIDIDAVEMKVTNAPSFRGVPWQPFVTELPWTLEPDPKTGVAIVYVRLRDANGNVNAYAASDGILYDPGLVALPAIGRGIDDDLLESGAVFVSDYPPLGSSALDLAAARGSALGLQTVLGAANAQAAGGAAPSVPALTAPWQPVFTQGNGQATAGSWRGSADSLIDTVDLVYFAGQARPRGLVFLRPEGGVDLLLPEEAAGAYGDVDLEWLGLAGSGSLAPARSATWAATMNGLRLLMGFETTMADVPHGGPFAAYLRHGYSLTQAWFKALDRHQPPGVTARILAEQPDYYNDTQENHASETLVDDVYCSMRHGAGPARPLPANPGQPDTLPVLAQNVLSEAEAEAFYVDLGGVFDVVATDPIFDENTQTLFSADGRLEMDPTTGVYQYTNTDDLWQWIVSPVEGSRLLTPEQAQRVADEFLAKHNLLPAGMQFEQVVMDTMTCAGKAGRDAQTSAAGLQARNLPFTEAEISEYQIQYYRPYILPLEGEGELELPVVGAGANVRVYVRARAAPGVSADDLIVGVAGLRPTPSLQAAVQYQTVDEVTPLDFALVEALALDPELATLLGFAPAAPDDIQDRQVQAHGFAYWQGPIGSRATRLIPIYRLRMRAELKEGGSEIYRAYLPAAPAYMPPLARIQSVEMTDGEAVGIAHAQTNATYVLRALDAQTPLSQAGYAANLNIVLGSNQADAYSYHWYVDQVSAATHIGQGPTIEYSLPPGVTAATLLLEVVDAASPRGDSRSYAAAEITVDGQVKIYLPKISR